ncbi:MAG: UbiA prenyltransferase family protein [Armatimonadetes bacterium]|nr:UbiA prenyltransferase family protein [Anaerolineae bacterium]
MATYSRNMDQLQGLIQLTRWQEHIPFVVPLTVLGALLAVQNAGAGALLDWRLIAVTLANVLAVAYAFMINDIEDAPDDARDPARAARNPISSGRIHPRVGYNACRAIAVITILLYALGGTSVLLIGGATLLLSHLYSWRPVRLKAYPVTDIVSHSLMLSGLLLLAGYYIYHQQPGLVWLVAAGATLFSVYGQLYNQLRDFEMDKAAGLYNTAIVLGEPNTRRAIYLTIALAGVCFLAAVVQGVFPLWLGLALGFSIGVSMLVNAQNDMRGSAAADASAKMQVRALIVTNLTVYIWLAAALAVQFQIL